MKITERGTTYNIYGDELVILDQLKPGFYNIDFNPMFGFSLIKQHDFFINEKIYGNHLQKVAKALNAFEKSERNLGAIFSGDKGTGKSLSSKLICIEAVKRGYPVILVDHYYEGIANYIEQIEQEVVIMFDEFEKTFEERNNKKPQNEMLSLFDGFSRGKKLYIITCNNLESLNNYFINRPGRFHYHFRFEYPSTLEVEEYMKDKLDPSYYNQIKEIVSFSRKVKTNYDCLRAIAQEINTGLPFKEAIKDLNIMNVILQRYNIVINLSNGEKYSYKNKPFDLFCAEEIEYEVYDKKIGEDILTVTFDTSTCVYDEKKMCMVIKENNITTEIHNKISNPNDQYDYKYNDKIDELHDVKVTEIEFHRFFDKELHYSV